MRKRTSRGPRRNARATTRSQDELQRRIFHLKTLYDLSREVSFLLDTPAILKNLLLMVIGTFGSFRGFVVLLDISSGKATAFTDRGLDRSTLDAFVTALEGLPAARLARSPLRVDADVSPRPDGDVGGLIHALSDLRVAIWVPFEVDKNIAGAIALGEKLSGEPYTRDDEELLGTIGNQAAVAIQNARRHEEVVRYAEELATSLRRIQILESVRSNLAKFVPRTVQSLIEQSPDAPLLDKREADVSVMFADITGYTRLSAQMELDQVNRLVERYFGAFLDEIMRHGGDVNETAGDGLMVVFQDPDIRKHAEAAVRTALAIQQRTLEINVQLRAESEPITMHIGVNSGIASVGATKIEGLAGTRWTYTASGPTTNVAARLAALTEGGAVIISEETCRRLGAGFVVDDLGLQSLKNVAKPVRAYMALKSEPEPSPTAGRDERRRHLRQPVSWPVRLWVGSQFLAGRAVEASLYGVCVAVGSEMQITPGQSCRIDIQARGGHVLTFAGEVRHVSDRGLGIETKEPLPISDNFA